VLDHRHDENLDRQECDVVQREDGEVVEVPKGEIGYARVVARNEILSRRRAAPELGFTLAAMLVVCFAVEIERLGEIIGEMR